MPGGSAEGLMAGVCPAAAEPSTVQAQYCRSGIRAGRQSPVPCVCRHINDFSVGGDLPCHIAQISVRSPVFECDQVASGNGFDRDVFKVDIARHACRGTVVSEADGGDAAGLCRSWQDGSS